jgi:hypothetical protein
MYSPTDSHAPKARNAPVAISKAVAETSPSEIRSRTSGEVRTPRHVVARLKFGAHHVEFGPNPSLSIALRTTQCRGDSEATTS